MCPRATAQHQIDIQHQSFKKDKCIPRPHSPAFRIEKNQRATQPRRYRPLLAEVNLGAYRPFPEPDFHAPYPLLCHYLNVLALLRGRPIWRTFQGGRWMSEVLEDAHLSQCGIIELFVYNGIVRECVPVSCYKIGDMADRCGIGFHPEHLEDIAMVAGWRIPQHAILVE